MKPQAIFSWLTASLIAFSVAFSPAFSQTNFWELSNGPYGGIATAIVTDTTGRLYAAVFGAGVFRSSDNAATWLLANNGLTNSGINHMAITPTGHLFAATEGAGVFRSTDAGNTWMPANAGLTNLNILVLASKPNGHLFAGTRGGRVPLHRRGRELGGAHQRLAEHVLFCHCVQCGWPCFRRLRAARRVSFDR